MAENKINSIVRKLNDIRREGEERDAKRRAEKAGLGYVDLSKTPASIEAVRLVPEAEAKVAKVAAIQLRVKEVALIAYDPGSPEVQKVIEELKAKKYEVKPFVVSMSALEQVWKMYEFVSEAGHEITGKVEIQKERIEALLKKLVNVEAVKAEIENFNYEKGTTTELFEIVLAGGLANRASDIHFEAEEEHSRLRYRLDGNLHDIASIPLRSYDGILSRIKLLSGLKINVRGEPQDGRFSIEIGSKEIEMRVSIIPSEYGETIVMRILDPDSINVSLEQLGLRPDDLAIVNEELKKPHGLILNTGPTGSGKTTTLYAFLNRMVTPEIKIITVEDPIEYQVAGIEQTQVNNEVGYTFAGGLRSIMRQDPDVILVGEIRDAETVDIALQASLTGHMVFSTVHANDAIGAVPRLMDLGAKAVTIGPALNLVIAQRLVRVLCKSCKQKVELDPAMQEKIKNFMAKLQDRVDKKPYEVPALWKPVGCKECNNMGYKGRVGIFEFFKGGNELADLITKQFTQSTLQALAESQKMVRMQEDGILKSIVGVTTLEEVEGVTGPIVW